MEDVVADFLWAVFSVLGKSLMIARAIFSSLGIEKSGLAQEEAFDFEDEG